MTQRLMGCRMLTHTATAPQGLPMFIPQITHSRPKRTDLERRRIITIIVAETRSGKSSTFISSITVCVWVEPLVLFKYGFDLKLREYFKYYFMYLIITLICCILTYCLCSFITIGGFLALFLKTILCLLIPNIIIVLLFKKTKEFQYLKRLIKGLLTKIVKKGKKHEK